LDVAFLVDACLLNGNHLSFHLPQVGRDLLVTLDQKCSWPEHHNADAGRHRVGRGLTILHPWWGGATAPGAALGASPQTAAPPRGITF
jgi:hypothetical protein